MTITQQVENNFWSKVDKTDTCWNWTGGRTGSGYGAYYIPGSKRTTISTHRYVLGLVGRKIPAGLHIDHLCRNRLCVNPDHLEAVTPKENLLRGEGVCAKNATKTSCKWGHEFTIKNTRLRPTGGRSCRTCANDLTRLRHRKEADREGRTVKPVQSLRTACPQGHLYNETNTYYTKEGWRHCKTCQVARDWESHESHRTSRKYPKSFVSSEKQ